MDKFLTLIEDDYSHIKIHQWDNSVCLEIDISHIFYTRRVDFVLRAILPATETVDLLSASFEYDIWPTYADFEEDIYLKADDFEESFLKELKEILCASTMN